MRNLQSSISYHSFVDIAYFNCSCLLNFIMVEVMNDADIFSGIILSS